jgi:hypothetical protein
MELDKRMSLILTTPKKFIDVIEELNTKNIPYLVYAAIRTDEQDIFCLYCDKDIINEGYFGIVQEPGWKELLAISLCKDCEHVMHYKTLFEMLKQRIQDVFTRPEIKALSLQKL